MKIAGTVLFLSMASALTPSTRLGQEFQENARWLKDSKNKNSDQDLTWMMNYTIHFDKCHSIPQVSANGEDSGLYIQYLAEFSLCPLAGSCKSGCKKGGKYVVGVSEFLQTYIETSKEAKKAACQSVRENCAYNWNGGEALCYSEAGLENCDQEDGNQQFNIDRYLECSEMENKNGNKNGNNNKNGNSDSNTKYYIGPKCSLNGKSIHLDVFLDSSCSVKAPSGVYENLNYNATLPYSSMSMVQSDCLSCDDGSSGVSEMCATSYQQAGRCEKNMQNGAETKDNTACTYIYSVLPKMDKATRSGQQRTSSKSTSSSSRYNSDGSGTSYNRASRGWANLSNVLAWTFGVTTLLLTLYAFLLYRRLKRSKVALSETCEL